MLKKLLCVGRDGASLLSEVRTSEKKDISSLVSERPAEPSSSISPTHQQIINSNSPSQHSQSSYQHPQPQDPLSQDPLSQHPQPQDPQPQDPQPQHPQPQVGLVPQKGVSPAQEGVSPPLQCSQPSPLSSYSPANPVNSLPPNYAWQLQWPQFILVPHNPPFNLTQIQQQQHQQQQHQQPQVNLPQARQQQQQQRQPQKQPHQQTQFIFVPPNQQQHQQPLVILPQARQQQQQPQKQQHQQPQQVPPQSGTLESLLAQRVCQNIRQRIHQNIRQCVDSAVAEALETNRRLYLENNRLKREKILINKIFADKNKLKILVQKIYGTCDDIFQHPGTLNNQTDETDDNNENVTLFSGISENCVSTSN